MNDPIKSRAALGDADGGGPVSDAEGRWYGAVERLVEQLERDQKAVKAVAKAAGEALKAAKKGDLVAVEKVAKRLGKVTLAEVGAEPLRVEAAAEIARHLEGERARRRLSLVGALHSAAGAAGIEVTRLGGDPPAFELAPVTVEVDFEGGAARVLYAREEVVTAALDAEAILEARGEAMGRIRKHGLESETAFELIRRAYGMVLSAIGGRAGERIDLVDLLWPLSLLVADRAKWRKLAASKVEPFTRYQLAYTLHRLRRDGLLTHQGVRIDLGAATGGTTRDKRNVIFVPSGPGEGQYYLSMRLV
jgi:hypothetical protein